MGVNYVAASFGSAQKEDVMDGNSSARVKRVEVYGFCQRGAGEVKSVGDQREVGKGAGTGWGGMAARKEVNGRQRTRREIGLPARREGVEEEKTAGSMGI